MTEEQFTTLSRYVRQIADHMGLRDWQIDVERQPAHPGCHAVMNSTAGRKIAWVHFSWEFEKNTPEQVRHTVVHELVHVHLEPAWHYAQGVQTADQFKALHSMMEYSVDAIAAIIAPHMPPFRWYEPVEEAHA